MVPDIGQRALDGSAMRGMLEALRHVAAQKESNGDQCQTEQKRDTPTPRQHLLLA